MAGATFVLFADLAAWAVAIGQTIFAEVVFEIAVFALTIGVSAATCAAQRSCGIADQTSRTISVLDAIATDILDADLAAWTVLRGAAVTFFTALVEAEVSRRTLAVIGAIAALALFAELAIGAIGVIDTAAD